MNAKELKYLSLFEQMCKGDFLTEAVAKKSFTSFLNLDFSLALDVWDYVCSAHEEEVANSEQTSALFGGIILDMFYKKGMQKTVKALADLPSVRRAVFSYSPEADKGVPFNILVDLLSNNKTDPAEDIFKCVVKNERIAYGPFMKELLERVFIEILKKNPSKKLEMSRKLATLLLSYVSKIKTDERAMLEQRIRERM